VATMMMVALSRRMPANPLWPHLDEAGCHDADRHQVIGWLHLVD
jgi:hypothetical protein